jgi:hypothetical protein
MKEGLKRGMQLLVGLVAVLLLSIIGLLLFWSWPGHAPPFLGSDGRPVGGSISEKIRVPINGLEQGMFIRGRDVSKPVLLYLHGGMPDYFLARQQPTPLEDEFVVCWWEQRGSGLSYSSDSRRGTITVEQLIADTLTVGRRALLRSGRQGDLRRSG